MAAASGAARAQAVPQGAAGERNGIHMLVEEVP
jgi:hypothetical protein